MLKIEFLVETYVAEVRDAVEDHGSKDVGRCGQQHSVDLVVPKGLNNGREEVDSRSHRLRHVHTPDKRPDLRVEASLLEASERRNVFVGFAVASFPLETPDGILALHRLE